jgi:hypothetical protein
MAYFHGSPHNARGWLSTYRGPPNYRHRKKAAERAAQAQAAAVLDRLQWQLEELRASLAKAAEMNAIMAAELSRPVPLVW